MSSSADSAAAELRAEREALILEHVAAENAGDIDRVLATFTRPRYELVPTGEIFDGSAAVRAYCEKREATRPSRYDIHALYHADEAVIVELTTSLRSPGTARSAGLPVLAIFVFDGPDLTCERVYYDTATYAERLFPAE